MSRLTSIRSAIASHAADLASTMRPAPSPQAGTLSPTVSPLAPAAEAGAVRSTSIPFPSDRGAAATASPALAATLAAAPGSMSGGASGGMSGGVMGAIPSPRAVALPAAEKVLDSLAGARASERLDWRHSAADLLKLLDLDSSPASLRQLAEELGSSAAPDVPARTNAELRARLGMAHLHVEPLRHAS